MRRRLAGWARASRSCRRGVAAALVWACLAPGARGPVRLLAQAPPPTPADAAGATPAEIQRLFDAYIIMQAQRQLNLSDEQFPQFITRVKVLQDARRRAQQERNRILQDLRRLSQPPDGHVDEAQVRERLKALDDLDTRSAAEIAKGYEALDQILDVRQQAQFRVFEEQMERRKLELLMRARQVNPPTPATPSPSPPKP